MFLFNKNESVILIWKQKKLYCMELETKKKPGIEGVILLSSIEVLGMCKKLGIVLPNQKHDSSSESTQPQIFKVELFLDNEVSSGDEDFIDGIISIDEVVSVEEASKALDVFLDDCPSFDEKESFEEPVISEDKVSIFIWALLEEISKRSKKVTSLCLILKDDMCSTIAMKAKELNIQFEEEDFDAVANFLQSKGLISTSMDGIRVAKGKGKFTDLLHKAYHAWLNL